MTAEARQAIREALDRRARELLAAELEEAHRCAGCGGHYDSQTVGCKHCQRRHYLRRTMADPERHARMAAAKLASLHRRRADPVWRARRNELDRARYKWAASRVAA